jgi:hypothetical protein
MAIVPLPSLLLSVLQFQVDRAYEYTPQTPNGSFSGFQVQVSQQSIHTSCITDYEYFNTNHGLPDTGTSRACRALTRDRLTPSSPQHGIRTKARRLWGLGLDRCRVCGGQCRSGIFVLRVPRRCIRGYHELSPSAGYWDRVRPLDFLSSAYDTHA